MTWVVRAPARTLHGNEKKLYSQIRRTLWEYEPLRASHAEIFIDVTGDQVNLTGRVRTVTQKLIAESLVRRMRGVGEVTCKLVSDADVVRAVADALARDPRTAPYVLGVDARHGIVALSGEVPSSSVQQAALDVAAVVPEVVSVRARLNIGGPTFPPVALEAPA